MPTFAQMSPQQRQDHLEKMRAGKKKKRETRAGEAVLSKADQSNGAGHLGVINAELSQLDWKTLTQMQIRQMLPVLQQAVEQGQQALRKMQQDEGGDRCSACKNTFVNGRFFGQQQWHDHLTGGIAVLRSCSPACQTKIERMADDIKKKTVEAEHTRFNRAAK